MKLYVGNLAHNISEDQLRDAFTRFGKPDSARIITDRTSGQSKGFGFVEMTTDEEAQTAIAKLNEYQLGGRALTVNEARPKPEYAGGGFGGGYDAGGGRRRSEPRW